MKIRTDFVTNSSSSSFIICFNDMCELDGIHNRVKYDILESLKDERITLEYIQNQIKDHIYVYDFEVDGIDNWTYYKSLRDNTLSYEKQKKYKEKLDEYIEKEYNERLSYINGYKYITMIEYSDENGDCELEHDITPYLNITKLVISHH